MDHELEHVLQLIDDTLRDRAQTGRRDGSTDALLDLRNSVTYAIELRELESVSGWLRSPNGLGAWPARRRERSAASS
jgi:hypothetical protein